MPPTHPSQADVAAAYRTLITHETEPKEQDFYRARLQRLELTTEPECEFDCRSRLAAAGVGVYCPQCSARCADTDLATNLAKAIRAAWVDRLDWDELAQGALGFLTSTGRLIPAGGRGLEFSEVEALRSAWEELKDYRVDGYARPHVNQIVKVVGALFPATEPAKEADEEAVGDPLQAWKEFLKPKPIGWYRTMELDFAAKHFGFPSNPVFEDRYTAPDGGKWQWTDELQWELRCYPPAPAVPAGEETKAELCAGGEGMHPCILPASHSGVHADREGLMWNNPASSPVVPAPAETGPKTWCAITGADSNPGGEHAYVTVRVPKDFVSGQSMADLAGAGKSRELARLLAPFVAAEEG
ncbi:hypothetical protein [Rhodococcus erythropolis]|uniref:Uncharacterized protein n=1 Tax=Rhodococcus erythropolis TaxID=1833 RepID=A0A8I1A396_RHOER|nr:hypothetical protein [Rhodococcus erythropolis]MBH5146321.1 hypothetical protein [Rhodococcus erythropolis]